MLERIVTITSITIDVSGWQQTQFAIVMQGLGGDVSQFGEIADLDHKSTFVWLVLLREGSRLKYFGVKDVPITILDRLKYRPSGKGRVKGELCENLHQF
jgi:hypothetical protein